MSNWKIMLGDLGKELKRSIDECNDLDGIRKIYDNLKECSIYIKDVLKEKEFHNDYANDLESFIEDLSMEIPDPELDEKTTYEHESNIVDIYLEQFYDYCDLLGVWISE